MSNNLVSQHLLIESMQMGQLEPIVHAVDTPGRDLQMELLGPVSSGPMSQQQATPNDHVGLLRSMSCNPGYQGLTMSVMQSGQVGPDMSAMGMNQVFVSNKQSLQMETMLNRMAPQQMSTIPKRKAPVELLSSISVASKKRVAQMEHRPWLQQVSNTSDKGALQMQPLSNTPRPQHFSASSKRKTQMESTSNKSGTPRTLNSRSQNAQAQQSSKVQTESSESVRFKMRESLAAALALVSQQDKPQVANNNASVEAANAQGKLENSSQCAGSESADLGRRPEISVPVKISSVSTDSVDHVTGEHKKTSTSDKSYSEKCMEGETVSLNISNNENILNSMLVSNCDNQDFQSSYTLTTDDVPFSDNFFVKDELLQGNGLSWVLDSGMVDMVNQKEIQTNEEQKSQPEEVAGDCREHQSPELLAIRIESELFKLFGGVNKKYKEKGRSLLFNLKDRNNPELRERVMSGEIPPARLCSMTAEELASKELSQWRIAKAEELAQMVVLPDSDVDIRRLVKKTHKGEFQVEVEHEDNVPVELPGGTTSVARRQTNRKDVEATPSSNPDGIKGHMNTDGEMRNVDKDGTFTLTIPSNDGTDPMQGLMTDDALKDAEFLPPIVSLDEFMESLHSEPPFEDLPVESGKLTPISDKDSSEVGSQSKSSDTTPSDHVDGTPDKSEKIHDTFSNIEADLGKRDSAGSGAISSDAKYNENHADTKPVDGQSDSEVRSTDDVKSASNRAELRTSQLNAEERYGGGHVNSRIAVSPSTGKGECVWEGMLQLNILTTHSVVSIFKSGEKTSVKDWPGLLEIKGRVRLDAFEKFLQELRLSRTRAITVLHFVSKEESPKKNEQSTLREVADSYILDERVGFAEPMPRVELYFCPPHKKTVEMLSKILPKEQIEAVNAIDYGLIGISVWRKTQLTSISPSSSSHPKLGSKKQYFSTRRQDTNMNAIPTPKAGPPTGFTTSDSGTQSDDDDIPPGFGPAVAREEDDLPEFKFSGSSNPLHLVQKPSMGLGMAPFHSFNQAKSRPVEQMRELIYKYGQNEVNSSCGNWQDKFGATIQPWNDDDDDIPEWHPQTPHNQRRPQQQRPMYNSQFRPHMLNQSYAVSPHQAMTPIQPLQPPMDVAQGQRNFGPLGVPPNQGNKLHQSSFNCQPSGGQPTHSTAWHQNVSRSGDF